MSSLNPIQDPVKLIFNFFFKDVAFAGKAADMLEERYGPIESRMTPIPFGHTTYYDREMGGGLQKTMLSFENLTQRDSLPELKIFSDEMEKKLAGDSGETSDRTVNIDPGLLLPEKFILASGKNFPHRIYLGRGVYADLTLIYRQGRFESLPWTYTDYIEPKVLDFLGEARSRLLDQLRERRTAEARGRSESV